MSSAKTISTVLGESTPTQHRRQGARSRLIDSHKRRKFHHITAGEEEDLPDLIKMQVLMLQGDIQLPEC